MITTNEKTTTIVVLGLIRLIYMMIEEVVSMTKFRSDIIQLIPIDEETGKFHKVQEGNSKDYIYQMINELYPSRRKR